MEPSIYKDSGIYKTQPDAGGGMNKFVCTYNHNEHTGNRTFSEVSTAYLRGDLVCLEVPHSDGSKTLTYLTGISDTSATFLYIAYTQPLLYKVTCTADGWTHESKGI